MGTAVAESTWPRIITGRRYEMRAGAEIRIYEGFGRIEKVELKPGGRNAHVVINADHLTRPVQGWCETDGVIWPIVQEAQDKASHVAYRVILERRRPKAGEPPIDPSIPIEKLNAQSQCTSKVEFVYVVDGAGNPVTPPPRGWAVETGTPSSTPSSPEADLAPSRAEAPAQQATVPPPSEALARSRSVQQATVPTLFPEDPGGVPTCPICGTSVSGSKVRKHTPTGRFAHENHYNPATGQWGSPGSSAPSAPTADRPEPDTRRDPRVEDANPSVRPGPTLGSEAVQASLSMVELALELWEDRRIALNQPLPVPVDQAKRLAARLLMAADRCQRLVCSDGHLERVGGVASHCRSAIRVALRAYPVPWDGEPEVLQVARDQWVVNLAKYAAELIQAAVELAAR